MVQRSGSKRKTKKNAVSFAYSNFEEPKFAFLKVEKDKGYTEASIEGFYNTTAWKKLRNWYISEHPLCARCEKEGIITKGVLVDHIVPLGSKYNGDKLNPRNLQTLCDRCHRIKTTEDQYGKVENIELKDSFEFD